ncbi:MAG: branched-chain amino acid transport system substrate-binding protein [Thermoleophilaceae bacterium]|nr:branched-chain amino acid transport system substrate-binding protein [Thermoleophilaceae bacterium]
MRVRWLVTAICIAALTVGVSACGSSSKSSGGATAKISGTSLTIYSSLPEQGASGDQATAIENGAKLAVKNRSGKIGKYSISYKPLDDSLASTGAADEGKGAQNARTAVQDKSAIGYIGEYNSGISKVTIPILNQAGITQISPANTYVGLTSTAPGHEPGEPDKYYPTKKRTYARVVPKDTIQAAAMVTAAKEDGCKTIHVFNSKTTYSAGLARNIGLAAPKVGGLTIEGNDAYDPKAPNYRSIASGVKADCVLETGEIEQNGVQLMKDVAAADKGVKLYGADGICLNASADPTKGIPTTLAGQFKCTIATLDPKTFGPEGKKFFADYAKVYKTGSPDPYAIYGYEAMSLMLDSIQKASASGSLTRQGVTDAVFSTKDRNSVLGKYSIDKNGDTTLTDYGLYKIVGKTLTFDRVIKSNPSLVGSG